MSLNDKINRLIAAKADEAVRLASEIWGFAELPYCEVRSAAALQEALEKQGFTIEKNIAQIPTAFTATFRNGSGKPTIGLLAEYDALYGLSQKAAFPTQEPVKEGGAGHGFGFNMLAVALTGWLLEPVFGGAGSFYNPATPSLEKITIPLLEGIPILRCLSGHNMIVYLSWILVLVIHFMMYKTPLGFRLRALGENPRTLGVSGLHTDRYRYLSEIIVGVLCGLAGAFLSIGNLSMFTENMTSGRGYIAVAAVGFSNGYIPITALAGLIFGLTSSAAIQLQGIGFPSQLVDMTPYVITIVIILISAFNRRKIR